MKARRRHQKHFWPLLPYLSFRTFWTNFGYKGVSQWKINLPRSEIVLLLICRSKLSTSDVNFSWLLFIFKLGVPRSRSGEQKPGRMSYLWKATRNVVAARPPSTSSDRVPLSSYKVIATPQERNCKQIALEFSKFTIPNSRDWGCLSWDFGIDRKVQDPGPICQSRNWSEKQLSHR